MFDNIASLRFSRGQGSETLAVAMISGEGETMEYRRSVSIDSRVEDWMTNMQNEMRRTNRLITKEAIFFYCGNNKTRLRHLILFPFQCFRIYITLRGQNFIGFSSGYYFEENPFPLDSLLSVIRKWYLSRGMCTSVELNQSNNINITICVKTVQPSEE